MRTRRAGVWALSILLVVAFGAYAPITACARDTTGGGHIVSPPSAGSSTASRPPRQWRAANVTVDAARQTAVLNNPGWYLNQSDPIDPRNEAELRRVAELRPHVARVWIKPDRYYSRLTGDYLFDYDLGGRGSLYGYLDQVSALADEIIINLDQCAAEIMDTTNPLTCSDVLKAGLLHYKSRYPKIRYVEVFNEPDKVWTPEEHERPAIPVDRYYVWYQVAYQVTADVNAALAPAAPLLVGGPAAYTFNRTYLQAFLDRYAADGDPRRRLDFLSYHQYKARENPATIRGERAEVARWYRARGIAETPVFVTEYGVFPGADAGTDLAADQLVQAAAMATLGMYYVEGGTEMPMHWVVHHPTNDRKSMVVAGGNGAVYPYYDVVRMQLMLKKVRVDATSDRLSADGIGVHALATRDATGVAVLLANYQWTGGGDDYRVALRTVNLPPSLRDGAIRVTRYLVDIEAAGSGLAGELRPHHEDEIIPSGQELTTTVSMIRNSVALVVLTPVTQR